MMMLTTIFFASLFYVINASCPDDGNGWMHLGDSCYLVSIDQMSWYAAREFCWQRGGYLAEIKSSSEETAIERALSRDDNFWLGLSDLSSEGTWVWDESHDGVDFNNWASDQPQGDGDCGFKSFYEGRTGWHDYNCDYNDWHYPIHALCETDLIVRGG